MKRKVESSKTVTKDFSQDGSHLARNGVNKLKAKGESTKKFHVKIARTGTVETTLTLNAETISQAEAKHDLTIFRRKLRVDRQPHTIRF